MVNVDDSLQETSVGFISALPASVELPAGTGKTELLAATVREILNNGNHALVLTHTNAGVHAIRKRLKDFNAASGYTVSTITSFAFTLARRYPVLAGITVPPVPDWTNSHIYVEAATKVARSKHIGRMVSSSFNYLLVDEYQDCSRDQHKFVTTLATHIERTGVFGDRMQAIFGFADSLVPWTEVQSQFPDYPVPIYPWRWHNHNRDLGMWLLKVRASMIPNGVLDLSPNACPPGVSLRTVTHQTRVPILNSVGRQSWPENETVLVITGPSPEQTRTAAAGLGGRFSAMEEINGNFMRKRLSALADEHSSGYPTWLAQTVKLCFSGAAGIDKPLLKKLGKGQPISGLKRDGLKQTLNAIDSVLASCTLSSLSSAMDNVRKTPSLKLHSHEAWRDIQAAIRSTATDGGDPAMLLEQLAKARGQIRHSGRFNRRKTVSRTLLVKGLEYDHVVIANAADIDDQYNLYVALTRARKTITVLAANNQLNVTETAMSPRRERVYTSFPR